MHSSEKYTFFHPQTFKQTQFLTDINVNEGIFTYNRYHPVYLNLTWDTSDSKDIRFLVYNCTTSADLRI